jgi:hypothetical protein
MATKTVIEMAIQMAQRLVAQKGSQKVQTKGKTLVRQLVNERVCCWGDHWDFCLDQPKADSMDGLLATR